MMHPFTRQVGEFISQQRLLQEGQRCLVGLSGGADSIALLQALLELGHRVECVHCNFKLRGEEADRDERFCRQRCDELGVPFHVAHFATREYAEAHKVSIEMAARDLRYDFFEKLRADIGAECIAVAHHRDDAAETVLLNLIRGTGMHGLAGIAPRMGKVVRPLLCVGRADIEAFLAQRHIAFVTDSSNLVDDVVRNKIRLNILPLMREINPSVAEAIAHTAERIRQAADIFDKAMEQRIRDAAEKEENGRWTYSIDKLDDEYTLFYILKPLGFKPAAVADIYRRLHHAKQGAIFCSATHEVLLDRGKVLVQRIEQLPPPMRLPVEGKYVLSRQKCLRISKVGISEGFQLPKQPFRVCVDAEKVKWPLCIRTAQQGDRFRPLGMEGTRLVSDFLTDRKINLFDKRQQKVIADADGRILWVVGWRIDHRCRVTASTKVGLLLELCSD